MRASSLRLQQPGESRRLFLSFKRLQLCPPCRQFEIPSNADFPFVDFSDLPAFFLSSARTLMQSTRRYSRILIAYFLFFFIAERSATQCHNGEEKRRDRAGASVRAIVLPARHRLSVPEQLAQSM